jgi:hypothetical protein
MIAQSPRWRGGARPFSARPDDLQQAGCQGPPRCALGPCLPLSPTISGVRWSMRSWESVRPRRSRRQGVPRSHGPAEESANGTRVNFQLIARCLTTPLAVRARGGDTSQFNPATRVRCRTTYPRPGRAAPPRRSSTRNMGAMPDYSIRGPGAQPRHVTAQPGHPGSTSRATATSSDDRGMKLCMRTV